MMKALLFSGLVLGSATYLLATHSDTVRSWVTSIQPQAKQVISQSQQQLDRLLDLGADQSTGLNPSAQSAILVKQLEATVTDLRQELETLKAKATATEAIAKEAVAMEAITSLSSPDSKALQNKLAEQALLTSETPYPESLENTSPYMPVEERSEALMALVHRMEMKAAGN